MFLRSFTVSLCLLGCLFARSWAEDGTGLAATFFDNVDFTGVSVSRIDPTINFSAITSPAPEIALDWWSAIWIGAIEVPKTDTYTFTTNSDDGIIFQVDGNTVIQDWTGHAPTIDSGSILLTAGRHAVSIRYYNSHGTATLQWYWATPTLDKEIVPQKVLFPVVPPGVVGTGSGLSAVYYSNASFTGACFNRIDPVISFDWGTGGPGGGISGNVFSSEWHGWVEAQYSETYTFFAEADDGFGLWIDGQPVINSLMQSSSKEFSGSRAMVAGRKYDITVRHRQVGGTAKAILRWSSPLTPKQVIPSTQFYPADQAASTALTLLSPGESYTNPAWIEGVVGNGDAILRATCNGETIPSVKLNRHGWYLGDAGSAEHPPGLELKPGENTIAIDATMDGKTTSQNTVISWVTFDLNHLPYGLDHLTVRPNDRLRLTSSASTDNFMVSMSKSDGSSSKSWNVTSNAAQEVSFFTPGTFKVWATVNGTEAGVLMVTVAQCDFHPPIACEISFQRVKDIDVSTEGASDICLQPNDPGLLTLVQSTMSTPSRRLLLTPQASGDLAIEARIQGAHGPLLSRSEVDEFMLRTSAQSTIDVIQKFPDGSLLTQATLTMTPLIPNLMVTLSMYTGGANFIDGSTKMQISSNAFISDINRGSYIYQIIRGPSPGSALCHSSQTFQSDVLIGSH